MRNEGIKKGKDRVKVKVAEQLRRMLYLSHSPIITSTSMKKLPIGTSTLDIIRNDDCVYIDKTPHVERLANSGGRYFFLSRPRRFGKSLFIDTLKQAFFGNKALFKGLCLENHWNWEVQYPVIHLSFAGGSADNSEATLREYISRTLQLIAKEQGLTLDSKAGSNALQELVQKLHQKTNQKVVFLVDEYDKPILDVIDEPEKAKRNREILKDLYSSIKNLDTKLRFVFLTGVSKFSKVSLFSGLNNLDDISLNPLYADICGYTQLEMERAFSEHFDAGNVDKVKLKNGITAITLLGLKNKKFITLLISYFFVIMLIAIKTTGLKPQPLLF